MLPMGTIVAVCMLLGAVVGLNAPAGGIFARLPIPLRRLCGLVVLAAGLWNVFWYALRHLTEFWGQMALGSGLLLITMGAILVITPGKLPPWVPKVQPLVSLGLLGFGLYYGITISRL